ncbi:MAG: flagellar motor switch phosphatase FliY [Anaerosolibacter sp.]|jgi:flagellar motor switch protein FliN/FliY|uniref:flagellar motor switch phosphatase FliY n=1 Tax=Anaerosolibacter sp. TaxID=1872527 RepID=UPI002623563C|nr:flagellar motor switch phosphatase FliY [Anaerosolibacter sp.]MDF2545849.1 flagellar motor switch phosphatase FliY [Anaerosolibacter sp.]
MGDMLSQEEIDALLKGTSNTSNTTEETLDENEKDALGEIGNISMGTSATTLFTLLGQKVTITTPKVSILTVNELRENYPIPFVVVEVKYREGLEGTNLLVLKEDDVKIITDLMMGGDGTNFTGELTELHLSAISEAMNQMIGSASTSLAEMFHKKIDISPPKAFAVNFSNNPLSFDLFQPEDKIVKIAFRMVIGSLIDSEIMQIIPIDFAKTLVNNLFQGNDEAVVENKNMNPVQASPIKTVKQPEYHTEQVEYEPQNSQSYYTEEYDTAPISTPMTNRQAPVNVQPIQFQSFDEPRTRSDREHIALLRDVPLEITVELGRTSRRISEILELTPGSVIELDRLVGEPLDILVNGQHIAKGEVVVIDENYGIRVTDILNYDKKLNKLK